MEGQSVYLTQLVESLQMLPGVGKKSAQRLAYYIMKMPQQEAKRLSESISNVRNKVKECIVCSNFTENEKCPICMNEKRDKESICVVQEAKDIGVMERIGEYNGYYHVLKGVISPMEGIGPDELNIPSLLNRIREGKIKEVIVATNPNVEGEATAMYLAKLIRPLGAKVTRIAHGLPVGGDIEYADEVTLSRAMQGRMEI
ncbi:recombination mediator RecR [Proteinivorax hydrogeniformans]|uniref:Recombination protein RecR n=1 Tax=Proteinivorax hydrogeniformans TaxID=1826727 RepID=A0AAU8HTG5_9FIRM